MLITFQEADTTTLLMANELLERAPGLCLEFSKCGGFEWCLQRAGTKRVCHDDADNDCEEHDDLVDTLAMQVLNYMLVHAIHHSVHSATDSIFLAFDQAGDWNFLE